MNIMYSRVLPLMLIVVEFLVFDWYARFVFLARAYPRRYGHGKSFKRAEKHYKKNWTLLERLLWIPMFKEKYESKYRLMAYLSYIHAAFAVVTVICFLVWVNYFPESKFWIYEFIVYFAYTLVRFVHDNTLAREK